MSWLDGGAEGSARKGKLTLSVDFYSSETKITALFIVEVAHCN